MIKYKWRVSHLMMYCLFQSYSEILPREVSLVTKFTRNISLNTPIVSAAMDTVTESQLAISIAQGGWYRGNPQKHVHRKTGSAGKNCKKC